jgi:hypothetical protein
MGEFVIASAACMEGPDRNNGGAIEGAGTKIGGSQEDHKDILAAI